MLLLCRNSSTDWHTKSMCKSVDWVLHSNNPELKWVKAIIFAQSIFYIFMTWFSFMQYTTNKFDFKILFFNLSFSVIGVLNCFSKISSVTWRWSLQLIPVKIKEIFPILIVSSFIVILLQYEPITISSSASTLDLHFWQSYFSTKESNSTLLIVHFIISWLEALNFLHLKIIHHLRGYLFFSILLSWRVLQICILTLVSM